MNLVHTNCAVDKNTNISMDRYRFLICTTPFVCVEENIVSFSKKHNTLEPSDSSHFRI